MATSDDTPKVTSKSGVDDFGPGLHFAVTDEILKFLATAPPEIEQWANARAAAVRDGSDEALRALIPESADNENAETEDTAPEQTHTENAETATTVAVNASPLDSEEESAETGSNGSADDAAAQDAEPDPQLALAELGEDPDDSPGIALSTPASRAPRPHPQGKRSLSNTAKALIAIVAIVVVGFGVYTLGGFTDPATGDDPMNPHGDETAMAEFEAQRQRLTELKEYVKENPESIDGHLELGLLQFNLGQIEDAKQTWLTVTELDPEEIQAWYNLGFAYMAQDNPDTEAAKEAWQKVIDMEPDSPLAETVMNHMSALTGDENSE